ncbi:MAG: hypothetical protein QW338_02085 [Conexivisphaerales archaeon]
MCDTLVSGRWNNYNNNVTYFAKNSDREPDELQLVEHYQKGERKGTVKCTHIDVKFEGKVNAITISRPNWMWGAEMGINEYGVAIGNEAIFTKRKFEAKGLLGMDLLRLGLEGSKNAREAMNTIIQYLATYGQGGSNSLWRREHYDNSFLIADWDESYVLETFEKKWWYSKVEKSASISNVPYARRDGMKLNRIYTYFGRGKERARTTSRELKHGNVKIEDIMKIMRMHNEDKFTPEAGSNRDTCMHAGKLTRRFQTANSMIVEIWPENALQWFTFSPNPCISLYKPLFFGPVVARYSANYWERTRNLHDELSKRGWEAYSKAMEETISSQVKINEIVVGPRDMMIKGEVLNERYISEIYEKVKSIDDAHIQALKQL